MDFQDDWRRAVFSSQFLVFSGRLRVGKGAFFCLNQDLQDFLDSRDSCGLELQGLGAGGQGLVVRDCASLASELIAEWPW